MDDKNFFQGDVLLVSTPDDGDIVLEDGLIQDCRNFDTAAYLSLFGGNEDDLNGKSKETWWGNLIPGTKRNEWMQSEFGSTVAGFPLCIWFPNFLIGGVGLLFYFVLMRK